MKRSYIRRRTPLRNRGGSRFPHRRDSKYRDWIKTLPCVIAGQHTCLALPDRRQMEAAHVKTKGSGGDDRGNLVPLCPVAHDEQEGRTAAFEKKYHLNLTEKAADLLHIYLHGWDA